MKTCNPVNVAPAVDPTIASFRIAKRTAIYKFKSDSDVVLCKLRIVLAIAFRHASV